MEIIMAVGVNILFLALVCIGVLLERRVSRAERELTMEAVKTAEFLYVLEKRIRDLEHTPPTDAPRADQEAEKRFTQGVENILNYALTLSEEKENGMMSGL